MKILRFDSLGGASGDMILGALCGLGVDPETLTKILQGFDLDPFFLSRETVNKEGIQAEKITVHIGTPEGEHAHTHKHPPSDHSPTEPHHEHGHSHGHHHRHYTDIVDILEKADCSERVRGTAGEVFRRLGEAEAGVHGIPLGNVHFHEVGAMDSLVDIIGACVGLELLDVDAVVCGPLPVGQGTFECEHGTYPLPPPATQNLLTGHSLVPSGLPFELVTPTGAALLSTWHQEPFLGRSFRPLRSAYGAGDRDLPGRPNVLRAVLGELTDDGSAVLADQVICLESNLDDVTPETLGSFVDRCLELGALDAVLIPCTMKKGRPGILVQVLCSESDRTTIEECMFEETGTLGIRRRLLDRTLLDRETVTVSTSWGPVSVKIARYKGKILRVKPEMDECLSLARSADRPVREIQEAALKAYDERS